MAKEPEPCCNLKKIELKMRDIFEHVVKPFFEPQNLNKLRDDAKKIMRNISRQLDDMIEENKKRRK